MTGQTFAQEEDASEFVLEEITVTGSRIARDNDASSSPIVTVDKSLFEQSATASIETQLNKLPQFTPTLDTPAGGGDIQPTAQNTPGEATVALRGIGANRTLVLINGRRGTPSNARGVIDINTIPAAAIEYVEAISGGASSTYGADAMAGVLNFIMKDNFQGLQLDAQMGVTQEGDNFEYTASGVMGANLNDGQGNIMLSFSLNDRNDALQRDRDWYRDLWADTSIGGTQFFAPFSGMNTGYFNLPDLNTMNTVINGGSFTSVPTGLSVLVDNSGNVFSGAGLWGSAGGPGVSGTDIIDGYQFILQDNGLIGTNNIDNYLILPMERYNMYSSGDYAINDWLGFFAQGYFSKTSTVTVQEPSPITSGWAVEIDPTINRDAIPADLLALLDSRPFPDLPFQLDALLPFNRGSETDVYTYNMIAGLEGKIPAIDWTWEGFVSRGEAETTVLQTGFGSLQRFNAIINGGPNFGQGVSLTGNQGSPNWGFGASTGTCTSGLNPFDWGSVTQDCWDAIRADIKTKQVMEQTIYEANAQGAVIDLPAGELRAAVGASHRENNYVFQNDTLVTQGTSFIEQALGLYPSGNSKGTIRATEFYAELLVPVLSDLPGFNQFNLELGGRHSDYNTTGGSFTYKALIDWQTNDWFRVRGGYNRAERAPNVAELYLAPEQTFAVAAGGDVCSTNNLSAWSANAAANPENWQNVVALCGQLMRASGNAIADTQYYGIPYEDVAAGVAPTMPQATGPSFAFPTTIGNPNLEPEKADTWTLGVVLDSPFASPALSNMRVSIDYYQIKISDAIGAQSGDIVMQQCTDPAFNPTFDPNSPYCAGFKRNQDGQLGNLQQTFFNNGRFETSGIDLSIDWSMNAGPGRVGVNALVNYLIDKKSAELESQPLVDYAGTFGTTQNGLDGNSYRWRSLTTVSYDIDDLLLSLRWQHLPSIDSAGAAFGDTPVTGASSYDLFDLLGGYQLMHNLRLRFGIENVFNKKPPLTSVNTAATGANLPGGSYNGYIYDTNGRRFYLGGTINF